ncbi:hypothetical protein PIB30_027090 [Stylosanthes scabra]|uniref:Uncharacterized protein n=1 Tax=Stylosanthes scabra TaxID=79078 RepID=A0ABU6V8N6_9FABA|nr:hypothetical protein [Stylosanthes scabra]
MLDPLVEDELRPDDSDDEPALIEGDGDDDNDSVPPPQRDAFSLAEFQVDLAIQSKEKAILAMKNYNIRHVVEYMVRESNHSKYLGK